MTPLVVPNGYRMAIFPLSPLGGLDQGTTPNTLSAINLPRTCFGNVGIGPVFQLQFEASVDIAAADASVAICALPLGLLGLVGIRNPDFIDFGIFESNTLSGASFST